jgi:peptide/nickel transport system substrate-binding protein
MAHPRLVGQPQVVVLSALTIIESLGMYNETDGAIEPMLAESWSISSDFKTWTFKIRKGVQFHKGYGEMTAEDVVWSHAVTGESERHTRAQNVRMVWDNEKGSVETPDDYTIVVNTGEAFSDIIVNELIAVPRASMVWITSKKQNDEAGEEEANRNTAATGPWEIEESRTDEFWRLAAVEDHWRKTPYFAELWLWQIPEEAARVAGFQTGHLDTFTMALDSLSVVQAVPDSKLMQVPDAGQASINFYGQYYGTPEPAEAYDPSLPWVSADGDVDSAEWDTARKVRLALAIAIDRQLIVDTILGGFGHPLALRDWAGPDEVRLGGYQWDFDPDRAKQLLAEAGYPDGFSITLTTAIRNAPGEVEACEAIAQMWDDIGIDVNFQRVPYTALRPTLVGRTYKGATCHSVAIRLAPIHGLGNFKFDSVFNYGAMHPWLEDKISEGQREVTKAGREAVEDQIAEFMIDNVFGQTGLYVYDSIWAVGAKLEPWDDHIKRGDLRQQNGMEWARPRQ